MKYRRRADALWRRNFDCALVLRPGDDEIIRISGGGLALWLTLDVARTTDELALELAEFFDSEPQLIEIEVAYALGQLVCAGCVEELS